MFQTKLLKQVYVMRAHKRAVDSDFTAMGLDWIWMKRVCNYLPSDSRDLLPHQSSERARTY